MAATSRAHVLMLPVMAPLMLLAGCDNAATPGAAAEKRAKGEILGGTIDDEMIPLDQLRSQSPPMRVAPGAGDGDGGDDSAVDADTASEAGPPPDQAAPESAEAEGTAPEPAPEG